MNKTNLKAEREKLKISQKELGDIVKVSRQTIHAIETQKHDPKLCLAFKIAKFFGLPIEVIFCEQLKKQ